MNKIKLAQRKLAKAIRTLDPEAGRVARRNARARVFAAIKSLEHAIDAEFPLEPKARPPVNPALKACSERMTPKGFRAELKKIAPEIWDPAEVQLFANWILDRDEIEVRPIVLHPTRSGTMTGSEIFVRDGAGDLSARFVELWWTIARVIASRRAHKYGRNHPTDRTFVRTMFEVAQAWTATEWREHLEKPVAQHVEVKLTEFRLRAAGT